MTKRNENLVEFLVKTLYANAFKYDESFKNRRDDNRRFYKGDQWRRKQPSYKSKPVTNYLSVIVRDEIAIISDNIPITNITPNNTEADLPVATLLTKLIKKIKQKNNYKDLQYQFCKNAAIDGVSYWRPNWNPLLKNGEGDIEILIEKADNILRDPTGEDNYFIITKEVTLAEIYRNYPEAAPQVKANIFKESSVFNFGKKRPGLPVQSTDGSAVAIHKDDDLTVKEQFARVKFQIFWIKDSSVAEISQEEKENVELKPMYPNGRWVFLANEKIILKDIPCETKHFPIVPYIPDTDPGSEINGMTNMDYCKQSQTDYNEMYGKIKDWFERTVTPTYKYDKRSGFNPKKMVNKSGTGIPTKDFEWLYPPPLPNEIFHFTNEAKTNIEYVSAMNDITQGRRPSGIVAAKAIHLLQEASKTMIRPKARLLETSIKKLDEILIDLIQYGYSGERILFLTGEEEAVTLNKREIIDSVEKITNNVTVGEYDVEIEPDSTLPVSRIERFGIISELFDKGAADRYALLTESGLPDWQEVNQRLDQREQEMKQQEAQAQEAQAKAQQEQAAQEQRYKDEELAIKREELELKKEELKLRGLEVMKPEKENVQKNR